MNYKKNYDYGLSSSSIETFNFDFPSFSDNDLMLHKHMKIYSINDLKIGDVITKIKMSVADIKNVAPCKVKVKALSIDLASEIEFYKNDDCDIPSYAYKCPCLVNGEKLEMAIVVEGKDGEISSIGFGK